MEPEPRHDQHDAHSRANNTECQLLVAECLEEVAGAARGVIEKGYHAIIAISRTVVTLFRLSVQVATLALAVICLTLAVGAWAYAKVKKIWLKMFA